MSFYGRSRLQISLLRFEPFDAALVSAACTAIAGLWAVRLGHGTPAMIGAGAAGVTTAVAMVSAQVRVGLMFLERSDLRPVALLVVAVPVWFAAAALAAVGSALAIPFAIATAVFLRAALMRPALGAGGFTSARCDS